MMTAKDIEHTKHIGLSASGSSAWVVGLTTNGLSSFEEVTEIGESSSPLICVTKSKKKKDCM